MNTQVVLITLVVYLGALLAVGVWASQRSKNKSDYFIGGRGLGSVVSALSYAASSSSAWSILGISGIAFVQGISAIWMIPGTLSGHLFVWFVLAPKLRERAHTGQHITLTDVIVENASDKGKRRIQILATAIITFSFLFYIAAQFQGAANTFVSVFGSGETLSLLVGAGIVVCYTLMGGFWAVSVTDGIQGLLMLVASLLLPAYALFAINDWPQFMHLTFTQGSLVNNYQGMLAAGFVVGLLSVGFGPLGQPHLLTRIMAISTVTALRRARLIAISWFVIVLLGMFFLGLVAHALGLESPNPENVFFVTAEALLPELLSGVLVAAVLSAIMSTADSQLLVAASAFGHDLKRRSLTAGRGFLVGLSVLAVVIALYLPDDIFNRVLFAWNALGATFGPVLIARLWRWNNSDTQILSAMASGFVLTVCFYLLPNAVGDILERAAPFLLGLMYLRVNKNRCENHAAN